MNNLPSIFQSSLVLYLPVAIIATFALLLIPSLLVTGAKAENASKAISCYLVKSLGLLLMAISAVQLTYSLVSMRLPSSPALTGLILLCVIGLGLMLHASRELVGVDAASCLVPRLVFSHSCEVIGTFVTVISGLSLMMTFVLTQSVNGWEMSATLLLLGMLLMMASSVHIRGKNHPAAKKAKKR